MTIDRQQTTREIAIQHPAAVAVFESFGIDYCCGGTRTLAEACEQAHIEWNHFIQLLHEADTSSVSVETDWSRQPLDVLSKHVVDTHHAYVRRATPHIYRRLGKVVAKHGAAHPELTDIQDAFDSLSSDLSTHMLKEECILFPGVDQLAEAARKQPRTVEAHLTSVEAPIQRMIAEHDVAGRLIAKIRALSGGYQPPPDACPTYRALYHGLGEFEQDLHLHVHLENNILFPAALELAHRMSS